MNVIFCIIAIDLNFQEAIEYFINNEYDVNKTQKTYKPTIFINEATEGEELAISQGELIKQRFPIEFVKNSRAMKFLLSRGAKLPPANYLVSNRLVLDKFRELGAQRSKLKLSGIIFPWNKSKKIFIPRGVSQSKEPMAQGTFRRRSDV